MNIQKFYTKFFFFEGKDAYLVSAKADFDIT